MPIKYKVLGQVATAATTATDLYTVPSVTEVVISTITICNRGATATTYRVAVRPNAEALATKHYIAYDVTIQANQTDTLTLGITLDAADVVTVYAGSANVTFNAYGTELT
jgi:hypothetical protein